MNAAERRRLVGVLGLLASDQDGERAAAGLLATRMLRAAGTTWDDLIFKGSSRQFSDLNNSWCANLALAQRHIRFLRAWEQNFVGNLATYIAPTQKQQIVLRKIADSLRAQGRA